MNVPKTALEFGLIIWTGTYSFSSLPTSGLMAAIMAIVLARCDGGQDQILRRNSKFQPTGDDDVMLHPLRGCNRHRDSPQLPYIRW